MNTVPKGPAFLALWNNIRDAGRRHEYEQWHLFEHVPERVALPGFLAADRYRSLDAEQSYFTLYHLEDLSALSSDAYRDVFTHPTPWSARMRPVLSNFYRLPCLRSGDRGLNRAPYLCVVRWSADAPMTSEPLNTWLDHDIETGGLVHAEWGWAPPTESYWLPNVVSETAIQGIEHVALLQHYEPSGLQDAQARFAQLLQVQAARMGQTRFFMLQSTIQAPHPGGQHAGRRPPHSILFNHHSRG